MTNIIHMKGNLLDLAEDDHFDIVIQGCNCFNAMGGGIAREIAARYPHVLDADNRTSKGDISKLGNWTRALVDYNKPLDPNRPGFWLYNCYTQYGVSRQGEDVFEYSAFDLILRKLYVMYPRSRFGLPYIGMGLAGGNKDIIMPMIEEFATNVTVAGGTVTLVEFA